MFWDRVAAVYDIFGNVYNGKVDRGLCQLVAKQVSSGNDVLECACGTGMISACIAPKCRRLVATDYSEGMLRQARKKCAGFDNVEVRAANILDLDFDDGSFDVVVAANVIHLLDEPLRALGELSRVCKPGDKLVIPTYVNSEKRGEASNLSKTLGKAGADFKRSFTYANYRGFFEEAGFRDIETTLIEGRVPCAVAVIANKRD